MEDKPINFKPFKHQKIMINHMTSRERSIVFAGMGLGKSASTLAALYDLRFRGRLKGAVIVAPLRVTNLTWPAEIRKWDFSRTFKVCKLRDAIKYKAWVRKTKIAKKKGVDPPFLSKARQKLGKEALEMWDNGTADIYLINYEFIQQWVDELIKGRKDIPCNAVIFDEVHNAKNPSSKRIQQFRKVAFHFNIRIGLTGTLLPNGYLDLFAVSRLMDDGEALGKYITGYKQEYFYNPDRQGFKWLLRNGSKAKIEELMTNMTVTLSSEEYLKIPDVIIEDIMVSLPQAAMKAYMKLEKEFLIQIQGGDIPAVSAASLGNKLIQIASGSVYDEDKIPRFIHDTKIQALKKLVESKKKEGKTLLIVCYYNHEMDAIVDAIPSIRKFKEEDVDEWNDGEIPVWIAKYTSITEGLNLQHGGHNLCWFSPTYSHKDFVQLNARLARTGQEHVTMIYRILAKDTIDEAVAESLRNKNNNELGLIESLKALQILKAD